MRALLPSLLLMLGFASCGSPSPAVDGIDMSRWKADKNGCTGYRASVTSDVRRQSDKFKSLNEMEVVNVLGRPDRNELYKRNQKFFQYYLLPAGTCNGATGDSLKLVLRFNAVGLVREVTLE